MNNDTKKQLKKWGKPVIDVQWFLAQEYCEGSCYVRLSESSYSAYGNTGLYFDFNGDTVFTSGERFKPDGSGHVGNYPAGTTAYYTIKGTSGSTPVDVSPSLGTSYSGTFKKNNVTYSFNSLSMPAFKIEQLAYGSRIFIKTSNAS